MLSLGGGTLGTLVASGGAISVNGATVYQRPDLRHGGGQRHRRRLDVLNASGGSTTVTAPASVGTATVSGGVVTLNNTNSMTGLIVSGGSVAMNNTSMVATAALSGGTTTVAGAT